MGWGARTAQRHKEEPQRIKGLGFTAIDAVTGAISLSKPPARLSERRLMPGAFTRSHRECEWGISRVNDSRKVKRMIKHPTALERLLGTCKVGWDPFRYRSIRRSGHAERFEDMAPEIERESRQLIGLGYTDIAVMRYFDPNDDGYYHWSVTGRVEVEEPED